MYTIYVSKVIYPDDDMYVTSIDDYESYINAAQSDALNVSDIDTSEKKSLILLSTCNLETNKKRNIVSAYLSEIYER
ncbi:MAG: hypothetical protein LUF02_02500 [Erysipelotrichaceae bacterium]|nr:hypothetical protein [Erysipelotrichaceae bacterium]